MNQTKNSDSANSLAAGASYYYQGWRLLWRRELRIFILIPLLVNILLFVLLTSLFFSQFGAVIDWSTNTLPSWLAPLAWIAWFIIGALMLMIYAYSFNLITNIVAAPFYGLLAEKAEALLCAQTPPDETFMRMIPRVAWREIVKLFYFITRGTLIMLVVLFIGTIPLINLAAPILAMLWSAWSMALQYVDYPADNHHYRFDLLRQKLWTSRKSSVGFGAMVMLSSVIPLLNIFAMPAAVTGGVMFWLGELKTKTEPN